LNRIDLTGCRPEPLAGYLKGLAILRLVAEQADSSATASWAGGAFTLHTRLTADELVSFFLNAYRPTPVITPWNGGSGFWSGDNTSGIAAIAATEAPRFAAYAATIRIAQERVTRSGLEERPDAKQKPLFVADLRARVADEVLAWLDAALVVTNDGLAFPPLLGTGGNDGRLDFANNFMQRLVEQLLETPPSATPMLRAALFGEPAMGVSDAAIGQFFPMAAGGANAGPGFDGAAGTNPWDYVLLIEGAMCFAAATVRRLESGQHGVAVFPFAARAAAAGFGTAAEGELDSTRNELWLPLWDAPSSWLEVSAVFREGRARVGRRATSTATDFARALTSLGVDRGISAFARYAFHVRNGLAYQAVPIGRWSVAESPSAIAQRLDDIDGWLVSAARSAGDKAPAALRRAIRRLDDAILAALRPTAGPAGGQALLLALAEIEAAAADSKDHGGLRDPVPLLRAEDWLPLVDDGTPEFDLAASLAHGLRARWSTARPYGERWGWSEAGSRKPPSARVWRRGPLEARLLDLLDREQTERTTGALSFRHDDAPMWGAARDSVQAFVDGRTDDGRVVDLARALSLLTWTRCPPPAAPQRPVSALFAAARTVASGRAGDVPLPDMPGWLAAARREDGPQFTASTWRRLAASGVPLRGLGRRNRSSMLREGEHVPVRRLAAACRFPLSRRDLDALLTEMSVVEPAPAPQEMT
jgi:CRISPR-associated protein Csx17